MARAARHARRKAFDPFELEVVWSRLVAICDEAASDLHRSSFSTIVRENHDYACMALDSQGDSLAQSGRSIPSFIGTLPISVKGFMRKFPPATLRKGDVLVTNDPWLCTGHLPDITMAVPLFRGGRLIGFAGSIAHMTDIGGRYRSPDSRDVYEEGLFIPPVKLLEGGRWNPFVAELLEKNVRVPEQVLGDVRAMLGACGKIERRIGELLDEHGLKDLGSVGETLKNRSEKAMRAGIRELPGGTYRTEMMVESYEPGKPLTLRLALTVKGAEIRADYSGSSPQTRTSLNSVMNYTYAYTCYGLKCLLSPEVPNNQGAFRPVTVYAPPGCFLNAQRPSAVAARASAGHYLPAAVYKALGPAVPERIPGEAGFPFSGFVLSGLDDRGSPYSGIFFFAGGQGANPAADGLPNLSFPTNISCIPAEVMEREFPVRVLRQVIRANGGGAGRYRGGDGQEVAFEMLGETAARVALVYRRGDYPPLGMAGGGAGQPGEIRLNGGPIPSGQTFWLRKGDILALELPGGGGYGNPRERSREAVERDLANALVTRETARDVYGF
jgi:N-methylhydantoinase B